MGILRRKNIFSLFAAKKYSSGTALEVEKFLQDEEIHGYSMHTVYGPYDHIVRFWSQRNLKSIQAIAEKYRDRSIEAIMRSGEVRNLKHDNIARRFKLDAKQIDVANNIKKFDFFKRPTWIKKTRLCT